MAKTITTPAYLLSLVKDRGISGIIHSEVLNDFNALHEATTRREADPHRAIKRFNDHLIVDYSLLKLEDDDCKIGAGAVLLQEDKNCLN